MPKIYQETFNDGPGGWIADLRSPLPVWDGVAYCYSPWSVDANHAPPGAGYLHLLMYLITQADALHPLDKELHRGNRFVEGGYNTDLTDAYLTVRLRGIMDLAGPLCNNHRPDPDPDLGGLQLLLLAQAHIDGPPRTTANFILTGQPIAITPDWAEQTLHLIPDSAQWTHLGARHELKEVYGCGDIAAVLRDVNVDIIFVLFPLHIAPVEAVEEVDQQWAARDYKVDMQYLPKGLVMFDTVRIEYPL